MTNSSVPVHAAQTTMSKVAGLHRRRLFYFVHSTVILVVLAVGISYNGGDRKYTPVDPTELSKLAPPGAPSFGEGSCRRAYVNVYSSSIDEDLAAVCCHGDGSVEVGQYLTNLCQSRTPVVPVSARRLPLATRLARPLEAWLLPLLPILLRLLHQMVATVRGGKTGRESDQRKSMPQLNSQASSSSSSPANETDALLDASASGSSYSTSAQSHRSDLDAIRTTLRRLLFYFVMLNLRGWVLYIGANAVEDYVVLPWLTGSTVISSMRTDSMSDVEHDLLNDGSDNECWYRDALKARQRSAVGGDGTSTCYGRPFDFSDHVVLFLAQYLSVFVMEMLICYSYPFWNPRSSISIIWTVVHVSLFLYLHLLIVHALSQTAVYFHTPAEILVGYALSWILQLPIIHFMCSSESQNVKKFVGLPCGGAGTLCEKGD